MAPRVHVFCVPFIGAGHAVNMFNVAMLLANPNVQAHMVVTSDGKAVKWLKATGQEPNPHVTINVVADGKWENWHSDDARELVGFFTSTELVEAVGAKIAEISAEHPEDKATAVIFNPLMMGLIKIYKAQGLKGYLLSPVPYYMTKLSEVILPEDTPDTKVVYKGIGGSDADMHARLGDAIQLFGPMGRGFAMNATSVDGLIYSNTNIGLEGDQWRQPEMANNGLKPARGYMIGPLLPKWLEYGLDQPELLEAQRQRVSTDPCIQFMNKQETKSVVYVALGSHCQLTIDQAKLIINTLRKTKTKWILLFHYNTQAAVEALGTSFDDGVVTSWAPQVEVMIHPALKCVLSHGGFGTMIEGVFAGAPFITSPVMSDQFLDTLVLLHLGISLGCIAENTHEDAVSKGALVPMFPDDGGKAIEELFGRVFGTKEGEEELENARAASRRLRRRMLDAKATSGSQELKDLLTHLGASIENRK